MPNKLLAKLAGWYWSGLLSQYALWVACLAGAVGLLASRALVATAPLAGVVAVLANPQLLAAWGQYRRLRTPWYPALLYGFWLLSAAYTQNWPVWRHELYRLLPLLVVPLAFGMAVPLSRWQRQVVAGVFMGGVAVVAAATVGRYLQHYQQSHAAFNIGHNMPAVTGIFHIHFSIMLVLMMGWSGWWAWRGGAGLWWRAGAGAAAVVGLLALHLLAYRTGLLVLYGTGVVLGFSLLGRRRWLAGVLLLGALLAAAWAAQAYLPSVQTRLNATRYDVEQFTLGHDINDYSWSKRLAAWATAGRLVRRQPLLGVAPADVRPALMQEYELHSYGLTPANRVMVHNQYLHQLVGGGVVGLAVWLLLLFGPLLQPALRQNAYVKHFVVVFALAAATDSLLELQIGFNLFVSAYGFCIISTERQRLQTLTASA